MRSKRKHERFIKRLETEFASGGQIYRGISSDLSANGLFIRTKNPFTEGSVINITIHLPEGKISTLKGKVMRAVKTPFSAVKNGMGVLLLEKDVNYLELVGECDPALKGCIPQAEQNAPRAGPVEEQTQQQSEDFVIIACSICGAKNKVPRVKIALGPKCGKCKNLLAIPMP